MGALAKYFPGALPSQVVDLVTHQVLGESFGFAKDNTLFAHATCPDEINSNCPSDDLPVLLYRRWKGAFPLGGLAGVPFVGETGWGAFSAHVPVNGKILVLFAPHVGISEDGTVGYVGRKGQAAASSACGAALGALATCNAGKTHPNDPHDYQQAFITEKVKERMDEINAAECPNAALTHVIYDVQVDFLRRMLSATSSKFPIAVLGGIQINLTDPEPDHFMPLMFDVLTPKAGGSPLAGGVQYDVSDALSSLTEHLPANTGHAGKEHLSVNDAE